MSPQTHLSLLSRRGVPASGPRAGRWTTRKFLVLALISVAVLAAGAVALLRSQWFAQKVREQLLSVIDDATGGRAEAAAFHFDWKHMRVTVDRFVLHGTEPAGKPPLLRVASVALGLKVVSLRHYDVDLQYLDATAPEIYLIVYPDGRTNLPEPKMKRAGGLSPLGALVNLAIGRFRIENGTFQVESGRKIPFAASGRKLDAKFQYERAAKRYRGDIAIQPLDVVWNGQTLPVDLSTALAVESNRITIESARLEMGSSHVALSGTIENLVAPRVSVHYETAGSLADVKPGLLPFLKHSGIERVTVNAAGDAAYQTGDFRVTGDWRATGDASLPVQAGKVLRVRNLRATGKLRADQSGADLSALRWSADASYAGTPIPAEGQTSALTVRGNRVEVRGLAVQLLGGAFAGEGTLEAGKQFSVHGDLRGFEARRAVALYNPHEPLPWNSLLSGSLAVDGSLARSHDSKSGDLRVAANLTLAPAPGGTAVTGQLDAAYDALSGTLDLGHSVLNLPSSRLAVSGSIGRQMKAHLETRNLADFSPVLGDKVRPLPLKLDGSLLFDGTITGKLEDPRIAGHVNLGRSFWSGGGIQVPIDSFDATVSASPLGVQLTDASVAQGSLRARFDASVGLENWEAAAASPLSAHVTLRNAAVAGILARFGRSDLSLSGTLGATAQVSGTIGDPRASGQIDIAKGAFRNEPFDHLTASVSYDPRRIEAKSGNITAGAKQVGFEITFDHRAASLETGSLHFDVSTNSLPLEQIARLASYRTGLKGSAQVSAKGQLDVAAGDVRIAALNGDLTVRGLQLPGTPLRDVHITAQTQTAPQQPPILRATLESGFANSSLKGQGEWRLEGDYPGTANVRFSRLDLADLRDWLSPASTPPPFRGFAEGEIRLSGPARKPELMKGELRVESFELGPAANAGAGNAAIAALTLRNSGPIVATATNSVVTIESARLTARSTDLSISGRVLVNQKEPFDLRANGRMDLALLETFDSDITSSGTATFEAGLRGSMEKPQINGRVEIENAALNLTDFPNGLTKAHGVVVFAGDRATIQNLEGETGGGQIRITGFAGYAAGRPVFGLQAETTGVRIRYPEGISTVANAKLNFTGTSDRSILSGNVLVLRSAFNLQSDFGSLLARSEEPVRTPSANTGFLGGMNMDVQIQTAPDVQIESSVTQGVQAEATLRLRGTASNPALQGRINILQGQVLFFGTKYTISQGSVSFSNPVKIEPVLNVDLQTKARGIDITLTVAGPLDKLSVTPRSDPPLEFNEIVSVLATGSYPSDAAFRFQQGALPQTATQSSATALLGSVLASPVTGRLQQFFGVSGIRIDPTLPGIEYNAQARLTLQQQVTPDITFTYIANVTQANPQVVSVEWAISKQWSVVTDREENGLIGLDFFFKKRFK